MDTKLREAIRSIVKEVLIEELGEGDDRDERDSQGEQGKIRERGRVRDPEHDRRLKGNREAA